MGHPRLGSFCSVVLLLAVGCSPASSATDASTHHDAGVDAAAPIDVGPLPDTGPPPPCAATFASCDALEDHTADDAVTLAFSGFAYTPKCIRVHAGTVVTIPGSSLHPLRSATCSPPGPIPSTPTPTNGDYTFTTAGTYGYYCNNHGTNAGGGMAGLIVVE
jgi:plastocyanin